MANAETIKQVESIILADDTRRYIVVSAPGKREREDAKVTDLLYRLKRVFDEGSNFKEVLSLLQDRFFEICRGLEVDIDVQAELDDLKEKLEGGASEDFVASRGEYLSAKILARKLGFSFCDTQELVRFKGNDLALDETIDNLSSTLKGFKRAVLPGFYGSDERGVKTFSRGGSDITGALVAAAVCADVYENWTDVDGVYTADPRKDKNAKFIENLTYDEMFDLAKSGANVLHKDAVYPAQIAGIKINIKNTFNPSSIGTTISN